MTIEPNRIEQCLAYSGFRLSYYSPTSGETFLARRVEQSLFEYVHVGRAIQEHDDGTVADLMSEFVGCSVVPGRTALKGLAIAEYLPLPTLSDAHIGNEEDARRWLEEFAAAAPSKARAARQRHGESLLTSTREIRQVAADYLWRLPNRESSSVSDHLEFLRSKASPRQQAEAQCWCKQRVIVIPGGERIYEAAALLIAIHQDEVEHSPSLFDGKRADDICDRGLMLRLQLLASHIACEPGWRWPIVPTTV